MKVLLIIPAYNEEENIVKTVQAVVAYAEKSLKYDIDYIVINDGSVDKTKEICWENKIHCINLTQNLGIGGAVQTGYIYADILNYDIAVQFDGDGQHDINSLEHLLVPICKHHADFVIGSRFINNSSEFRSTLFRRIGIKWLSKMIKLICRNDITDPTSGFRAANREVIHLFAKAYPSDYPEPEAIAILLKNKFALQEVPVNMFERQGGTSSINIWKSIYYMIKVSLAIICATVQKRDRGNEKCQ